MVTDADIQALADRIAAEFRPEQIILFGSQAGGKPSEDSDVDLMVVLPFEGPAYRTAARIRAALPGTFRIDLIARTPADMRWRYASGDPFVREAVDHGVLLYTAAA
ncbi:MAG: nucleotidyltransferase domain-containing protein [Dehalococcoidia bacterium]